MAEIIPKIWAFLTFELFGDGIVSILVGGGIFILKSSFDSGEFIFSPALLPPDPTELTGSSNTPLISGTCDRIVPRSVPASKLFRTILSIFDDNIPKQHASSNG